MTVAFLALQVAETCPCMRERMGECLSHYHHIWSSGGGKSGGYRNSLAMREGQGIEIQEPRHICSCSTYMFIYGEVEDFRNPM